MKNAIVVHGKPDKQQFYDSNFPSVSNYYWLPWLQKQLAIRDTPTQIPEVPNGWIAYYPTWQKEFERYEITPDTILIGHSCGSGFLVRWLSEHKDTKANKVVLAAPWIDPRREHNTGDFFDFEIDPQLLSRTAGITIINSDDDYDDIHETVEILRNTIPGIKYVELHNYGHFYDERRMQFPELLEEILS